MEYYGYIILAIPFLILLGWVLYRRPDLRKKILKIGILGGFIGVIAQIWYLQDYWYPYTFLGHGVISFEDFIVGFCLVTVGAIMPFYVLKLQWPEKQAGRLKRMLILVIIGVLFMTIASLLKVNSIISTYILFVAITTIGLVRWPWLWKSMLISAVCLVLLAMLVYWFWSVTLWFDWNNPEIFLLASEPWMVMLFGFMPITEFFWYILWGTAAAALPYIINNPKKT